MKKYWITYFLLLFTATLYGQSFDYGNSWFSSDPTRPFIKILVDKDGLYKVTKTDLVNAGHSVINTVDATQFRLYYRGKEVPINVFPNNTSAQFDYFYFFGKRNNGSVDSLMYRKATDGSHDPDATPNINFSIFTDTSAYFLTWVGGTGFAKRYLYDKPLTFTGTPEPQFWYESSRQYAPPPTKSGATYVQGAGGNTSVNHVLNSDYTTAEGYCGPKFEPGAPVTITIQTPYASANQPTPPIISARVFGRSESSAHLLRLEANNNILLDTTINSVYVKTFKKPLIGSISSSVSVKYSSTSSGTDNNHVCATSVFYWRDFNLNGDTSILIKNWQKNGSAYFAFTNAVAPTNTRAYAVSMNGEYLMEGLVDNTSRLKVIMPQLSVPADVYVVTELGLQTPIIKSSHNLTNLHAPADGGAELIIITNRSLMASAMEYKKYRDTCTFNPVSSTKVVYTDEIMDEYGYGSVTPWAIKRFCKDALDNWTNKPKYILLWGKGGFLTRPSFNALGLLVPNTYNLMPTFGYPASDYEFISHFGNNEFEVKPEVAIGRVNIFTDAQGMAYLNKVIAYEHTPWNAWMKRGVLLGGGENDGEQSNIRSTLTYCKNLFEAAPFGGDVFYYQKTSSATLDPNASEYHNYINSGTTIIHFFGHSSSNISDIQLKEATEYNNYGRVPFIFAEGCYGGDFSSPSTTFGERWLLQPERGGIGYLANSSEGFLTPLQDYAEELYQKLFGNMLGDRLGDIIKAHTNDYSNIHASSVGGVTQNEIGYRNNLRQMNLQGDPLIRLHSPQKPDLAIDESSIYFTPEDLTSFLDSFKINIIVKNLGLILPNDTFVVAVRQRLPSGEWLNHPSVSTTLKRFSDTISISLINAAGSAMTGPNTFEVYVDSTLKINEYSEANNFVSIDRTVAGNIPAPIFPIEYAVIPSNQVNLVASSYSITRDSTIGYYFEVDTLYDFSSPFKLSSSLISTRSNYASWAVPTTLKDSTVYYWRVRLAEAVPSVWAYSTFRYINGKEGWAQAAAGQFRKDKLEQVELDVLQKEWKFSPKVTAFQVGIVGLQPTTFSVGQNLYAYPYDNGGILMAVVNQYDLSVKFENLYTHVSADYSAQLQIFKQQFLSLVNGDHFFIASSRDPKLDLWSDDIFDFLEQMGVSSNLRNRPSNSPFIIYGRKGIPNSIIEIYTPVPGTNVLRLDKSLYTNYTAGTITSPKIGPSMGWHNLIWKWKTQDPQNRESCKVDVYAVRQDGTDSLALADIAVGGSYDLSAISDSIFPYLYLKASIKDTVYRSAPQLDNWHILYDQAPDAIIDPFQDYVYQSDSLEEGEDIYLNIGARNPTKVGMDSLLVAFKIERENRSLISFPNKRFAKLPQNGRINISKEFVGLDTLSLQGKCRFFVELNPNFDQREQYTFNNIYVQDFFIIQDKKNPILDVTFDGKHITDLDITSPNPEIIAQLKDENLHLAMEDTTTFEVRFSTPGNGTVTPVKIPITGNPMIKFEPASLPSNKAKLYFYPGKFQPLEDSGDGYYRLQIQGKDARGNLSGKGNSYYDITFKVVNEKTITNVLNYPNPFSTSTRFVYTLTGDELPDFFQIHIYTITGKLVKIIDLVDLGEMHFGKNITNYAWDGTDEYGDKLANGVYLYRVISRSKSNLKESSLDDKTDKMFKADWGKMYIMR